MTLDPKPILSRLLPVELHRLLTRETLLHETIAKVVLEYLRETARPIHAWGDRLEAETVVQKLCAANPGGDAPSSPAKSPASKARILEALLSEEAAR